MKPATNAVAGCSYISRRRPDLLDPPVVEDGDPIAHRERLFLVVRDVDERHAELLLDLLELDLELLAQLQVEGAERLVEQERPRRVDDRPRERDALALAAGELTRLAVAEALEPHEGEHLARLRLRRSAFGTFFTRRPYSTFCCTVMCGNSA